MNRCPATYIDGRLVMRCALDEHRHVDAFGGWAE